MARVTYYVVLPFVRGMDGDFIAVEAEEAPTANAVRLRAQGRVGRTIGKDIIVGAVVFSRTGDPQTGDFDDAEILARFGETPEDLEGMG